MDYGSDPAAVIRARGLGKLFLQSGGYVQESLFETARRLVTGRGKGVPLWALREVSFDVHRGEVLGVIGPNGAGKTTLLLLLAGILSPTKGSAEVSGELGHFFQLSTGLQPGLSVLENFRLCAALLGIPGPLFEERFPRILEFSGLKDRLHAKFGELSTGLASRLAFSIAVHANADILLIDELLSVGDAAFQKKCGEVFLDFREREKTMVIVSHSMQMISALCTRALYLKEGRVAALGEPPGVIERYLADMDLAEAGIQKQYTRGLRPDPKDEWLKQHLESKIEAEVRSRVAERILPKWKALQDQQKRLDAERAECKLRRKGRIHGPGDASDDLAAYLSSRMGIRPDSVYLLSPAGARFFLRDLLSSDLLGRALAPGDEVLISAFQPHPMADLLNSLGWAPVLVDIDFATFTMDINAIRHSLSQRSRVVIVRHSRVLPCDMDRASSLREKHGLILIEDIGGGYGASWRGRPAGDLADLSLLRLNPTDHGRLDLFIAILNKPAPCFKLFTRRYPCRASLEPGMARICLDILKSLDASRESRAARFMDIHQAVCRRPDAFDPLRWPPHAKPPFRIYPLLLRQDSSIQIEELERYLRGNGVSVVRLDTTDNIVRPPRPAPRNLLIALDRGLLGGSNSWAVDAATVLRRFLDRDV